MLQGLNYIEGFQKWVKYLNGSKKTAYNYKMCRPIGTKLYVNLVGSDCNKIY